MKVASSRAQRCAIMRSCANSSSIRTTWGVRAAQRRLFDTLSPLFVLTMALQQWPVQALHHSASNICQASIVCQHLPGQHRLPTSASNICPGHQHLPATSADICWSSALNLNSQHLNGPSICPSISSISASIWPAHPCAARFEPLSLYWGVPPSISADARTWSSSDTIATTCTICGVSGPKVACKSAQLGE